MYRKTGSRDLNSSHEKIRVLGVTEAAIDTISGNCTVCASAFSAAGINPIEAIAKLITAAKYLH